jgi:glycerol-3-phosphate dehydrogenase (NAD(P)+)
MQKVLIIGGGRIGSMLKKALVKSKPIIWDLDPKVSDSKKTLPEEVKNKDLIFICVPTMVVEEVLTQIKSNLKKDAIIISLSKGLNKKGQFTYEILNNVLVDQNYGILAGALMAEEIKVEQPTIGVLGLKDNKDFLKIKTVFADSPIHLINSNDLKGLAIGGTLKNVYALFLGMVEELKFGDNLKAIFLTKAFREMKIIAQSFGAKLNTINSYSGLADLVVTAYSSNSHDLQTGKDIIKGNKNCDCEGLNTLKLLNKRIHPVKSSSGEEPKGLFNGVKNKNNLPILNALLSIIEENKNAKSTIKSLLPN